MTSGDLKWPLLTSNDLPSYLPNKYRAFGRHMHQDILQLVHMSPEHTVLRLYCTKVVKSISRVETLIFCGTSRQLWFSYWSFTLIFLPYSISGTSAQHFRQTKTNGRRLETSNKEARKARRITNNHRNVCLASSEFLIPNKTENCSRRYLRGTLGDFNFSKCHRRQYNIWLLEQTYKNT